MKKLGTINVAGIEFTVYTGTAAERDILDNAFGYCDRQHAEIWLREGLSPSLQANTILHEIIHGVYEHSGVSKFVEHSLKDGVDKDEFEETLIQLLVPHLLPALADARKLKS